MKQRYRILLLIATLVIPVKTLLAANPLPVFVSILPQQYMVEEIGKDKVAVRVMVRPGASPATYEPKPAQMAALSRTRLYFSIGVPFETFWLDKIAASNPEMKMIHTDQGIRKIPMATPHHHGEEDPGEKEEGETKHGHRGLDPHIWTSPGLVRLQAQTILAALIAQDPENESFYTRNHADFTDKLTALDRDLKALFKGKNKTRHTRFMVFHPSWGYFARDYGLDMIAIEIEGKSPKPAQLKELIQHARENDIKVLFVQPQFSAKSAELIAREIQGRVVTADPLALDWMENMKTIAAKFKEVLK